MSTADPISELEPIAPPSSGVAPLEAAKTPARRCDSASGERPPVDATTTIRMGLDLHRVVDDAAIVLAQLDSVFQRDGELVHVTRSAEPDARRGVALGTPQIRTLALASVKEALTRAARWERYDNRIEDWRPCTPSGDVCSALHARGQWERVRPLGGVIEVPCLRLDGTILATPGYDAATGLLLAPSVDVPIVDTSPTQADARAALRDLLEPIEEFSFASDASRYVVVAAVLTMLARPAIVGAVPLFALDASTRGSGKSLLADVIATIATGRAAPRMTYPADEAELEKVLASAALFGARLIALDNIASALGAAPLDKVLTCTDRVALRVLGRSELREIAWRAVIVATGNNLVLGADTARRTLVARLEPDVEHPEDRSGWRHPELLVHVRAHRSDLVRAGLTVLRAFVVAGQPNAPRMGSFEAWSKLVAGAILFAGGENVLEARATRGGVSEPEVEALRVLLAELPRLAPDGMLARDIIAHLYPPELLRGERRAPDGFDALREALDVIMRRRSPRDAPSATALAAGLRKNKGRVVGGRRLESREYRAGLVLWHSIEAVSV